MGMTVCRTWAFSDGDSPNALQVSPGVFNERVFKGLDYVIVEARRHRIRLILSLVNNLNAFGGKAQYVRWAKEAGVNVSSSTDSHTIRILDVVTEDRESLLTYPEMSFLLRNAENGGIRTIRFSVSLAGPDGRLVKGGIAGLLGGGGLEELDIDT
ncbi:hypothetical protein POM88_026098 [Heracleum sosnowskyi]|uniref:mannan endo-1,4-beta-mannosidase n=1 Tax=Heracleum sosnowskyi TaxID=360622 RepID=A0AAD8MNS0_9APIA|nr:hypothetical protein POM88_026098 [Heracleum sosnowskyi]